MCSRCPTDPAEPVSLTEAGQHAFDELFQARHDAIARLAADWQPEQHPRLLELLTRLTHQLAAGSETPGPDLDPAAAAACRVTARAGPGRNRPAVLPIGPRGPGRAAADPARNSGPRARGC